MSIGLSIRRIFSELVWDYQFSPILAGLTTFWPVVETSESPQTARPPNIAPFNIIPLEDRVSPEAAGNIDLPATHGSSLTASEQTTVAAGVHSFEHSQIPLPSTATTAPDNSSQTRRPLRKGARPLPPSTISAPRLHEDGGVRLQGGPAADPENLTDIPPVYRPYWPKKNLGVLLLVLLTLKDLHF